MWPDGKKFAFTVFHDTDNDVISNVLPVYHLLSQCNMRTSKSVWVYPPRDHFKGFGLVDPKYLQYIRTLANKGFEICLHNVGSGKYNRDEIEAGVELFKEYLGHYPKVHANHGSNVDNLYWGSKRFKLPLSFVYTISNVIRKDTKSYHGDDEKSQHFWGDIAQKRIKYVRNFTYSDINTLRVDYKMPYVDKRKPYVNYWFSSSDGHTVEEFTNLISDENVMRLEKQGGLCIVYTHLASGFVDNSGIVNKGFAERIENLSQRPGWFAPVGEILDWLLKNDSSDRSIKYLEQQRLNLIWLRDRVIKRIKYNR